MITIVLTHLGWYNNRFSNSHLVDLLRKRLSLPMMLPDWGYLLRSPEPHSFLPLLV